MMTISLSVLDDNVAVATSSPRFYFSFRHSVSTRYRGI